MSLLGKMRNAFSTKVEATVPLVNRKPVTLDVWLSPSCPDWEFVPQIEDGPYRLIRGDVDGGDQVYGYAEGALDEMIGVFHRFHGPRRDEQCFVLDRHAQVMLGWMHSNGAFYWFGCRLAFEVYAVYNPVDAAVHEVQAAEYRRLTIGEEIPHGY